MNKIFNHLIEFHGKSMLDSFKLLNTNVPTINSYNKPAQKYFSDKKIQFKLQPNCCPLI